MTGSVGTVDAVIGQPAAVLRPFGATVVEGLTDTGYGSRGFTVRDPEGVYWSFGTYPGE
ncbi:hypothetical protein [Planosporangium flavigriseum]|uniref:Glyoxalase n=1 Tax=Planosporangium flavigriseum TaxID=373681 RepID=A0A8J3PPQ4_9ACTN|nr:hypothetical protein [Planosporangium flavigriseum]GIG76609.1 hypothetical protein Pfl04_50130 [Planosporangium flavigriseum]